MIGEGSDAEAGRDAHQESESLEKDRFLQATPDPIGDNPGPFEASLWQDDGKFVAIDVETGDYEMDEDDYAAIVRLRARKAAADVWLMRAGYPTAYKMRVVR